MAATNETVQDELTRRVIKLAAAQVSMAEEDVSLDSNFGEDLGYDSLDKVEFAMEVEDQFDLSLSEEVTDKIVTVGQAIDEIRKLVDG